MRYDKRTIKIAIVEENFYFNLALNKYLQANYNSVYFPFVQFQFFSFLNVGECYQSLERDIDIIILDYNLLNQDIANAQEMMELIDEAKKYNEQCKIILYSGQRRLRGTVDPINSGINDYLSDHINPTPELHN